MCDNFNQINKTLYTKTNSKTQENIKESATNKRQKTTPHPLKNNETTKHDLNRKNNAHKFGLLVLCRKVKLVILLIKRITTSVYEIKKKNREGKEKATNRSGRQPPLHLSSKQTPIKTTYIFCVSFVICCLHFC